jgi:BMFP domain-containing protein YqiC
MNDAPDPHTSHTAFSQPVRRAWVRGTLIGTALLLCGAVIGSALTVIAVNRAIDNRRNNPDAMPARVAEKLTAELGLEPAQSEKVQAIIERHHEKLREIRSTFWRTTQTELRAMEEEILAALTVEQREQFEARWKELMKRERERREHWDRRERSRDDDDEHRRPPREPRPALDGRDAPPPPPVQFAPPSVAPDDGPR